MPISFEDFFKHLKQIDHDCFTEGEIVGRAVYVVHVHEDNAERIIESLKSVYGARIFDVVKPSDVRAPSDEELEKLTPQQKKQWEKASHRWAFRCYIPPSGSETMYTTSEVVEKFIDVLQKALDFDRAALSKALMTNFHCNHVLAESHPTIRCNAIMDDKTGRPTPSVSCWAILNGLIEEVTGERITFKTEHDNMDLRDIADGVDPIVRVLRKTH